MGPTIDSVSADTLRERGHEALHALAEAHSQASSELPTQDVNVETLKVLEAASAAAWAVLCDESIERTFDVRNVVLIVATDYANAYKWLKWLLYRSVSGEPFSPATGQYLTAVEYCEVLDSCSGLLREGLRRLR